MGKKKSNSKVSEAAEEETKKNNDSSDIFKSLFGRDATEEQGLGLGLGSELDSYSIRNGDIDMNEEEDLKKKKKKKREKSNLDENLSEKVNEDDSEMVKKKKKELNSDKLELIEEEEKKLKRKKEAKSDSDGKLVVPHVVSIDEKSLVERNGEELKEKKKKKRKRDEIEEAYEAKTYGVVATLVGKEEGNKGKKVGEKRKSMDDPAEMMVSKEGFDDEAKLVRTIFVGNLPLKLKKKNLLKEFSQFGEVESLRIRSVPIVDSKTPRKGAIMKGKINESVDSVHAYIVFKDEKSAQASLSHNMAVVGGNHIRVDKACPPRKKLKGDSAPVYDNQRTAFVGNLPFDVKDEEVYQLFCGINQLESSIEAVRVIRDPNSSLGKGIAYVLFKTKEAANQVIRRRYLKIRDRVLRIYHAKPDAKPSKKRNLPSTPADNSSQKRLAYTSNGSHQDKTKNKTALSYQGLRASKSTEKKEGQKKDGFRPRTGQHGNQKPSIAVGAEVKHREKKRPAVAARKAKALKVVGASKQTGMKRKPESRTPDSFHRNKKFRKLK
ncbi:Nucleolar protein [Thalictrum thalictroides]|uniref:Nucleolar protein n=1 Tax=Thalictrum thalictroides TaxID=46969 RepID=A0A7J6VCU9_THATH|nr:Nucleolar protein [Thalictrum thalictroides]